ncbi:MAG TPA: DUF2911 domain-containing protein [Acidobacteriaceae bacterium]|jgi:hypothetical protein
MKTFCRSALSAALLAGFAASFLHAPQARAQAEPGSMPEMNGSHSQSAKPLASPAAEAHVTLDGKAITIHYNSPRMRNRKIMGELVPYGKVWRTGANPATSFVTDGDIKVGDLNVPAGKYTLYTLPAAPGSPWQLIINKQTGQWGTEYNQGQDLGRTPMHSSKLSSPQENMTISFEHTTKNSTELHVRWETTDQWVKIEAAH